MTETAPSNTRKYEAGSSFDSTRVYRDVDGMLKELDRGPSIRDIRSMLRIDPQAQQLSTALKLPVRRAKWDIIPGEGDNGEKEFIEWCFHAPARQGGMTTPFRDIISKMGNAITYKIAPFEKVWKVADHGPYEGKVVLHKLGYRPPFNVTLRADANGSFNGMVQHTQKSGRFNKIKLSPQRSLVYIHGSDEEPLLGTTPFEVVYHAYRTKLKVSFFFYAFLENVAFPRTKVRVGNDDGDDLQNLIDKARRLAFNGVIGLYDEEDIEAYESARTSREYQSALEYLDWQMAKACLGQFLDLGTTGERGSYALSQDKSNFFYELLDAVLQDIANTINYYLISDLIQYNFGRDAATPKIKFRPLNDRSAAPLLEIYKNILTANTPNVTPPFLLGLMRRVEEILDLDIDPLEEYDEETLNMIMATIPTAKEHMVAKGARAGAGQNPVTGMDKNNNNTTPQSEEKARLSDRVSIVGQKAPEPARTTERRKSEGEERT